ncbi:hypothetical protein, partial [Ferrimicrobium sp.]
VRSGFVGQVMRLNPVRWVLVRLGAWVLLVILGRRPLTHVPMGVWREQWRVGVMGRGGTTKIWLARSDPGR